MGVVRVRRIVGRAVRWIGLLMQCALLASCNTVATVLEGDKDPDAFEKVRSIDLLPRTPSQVKQSTLQTGPRAKSVIYPAEPLDENAEPRTSHPSGTASGETFELNFENSPVASVAKVVLGDILGVGYVIDPRVQGTISLSSGRPIPKPDVVFALENALRVGGIALIRDDTGYRLVPQADAVGAGGADDPDRMAAGYGISVVPLQYV